MIIDSITNTFKQHNEDCYGSTNNSFWVMDGASALNTNNFTPNHNDVVWVVNWWNNYLTNNIDNLSNTVTKILKRGVKKLNREFEQFVSIESLTNLDKVSIGIAISRINGPKLECFVLGDVEINIKQKSDAVITLTDTAIQKLDQQVIALMASNDNRENEIVFKGFTKPELDLLQCNRLKMNTEEGYYILEHCPKAINKGIYQEFKLDSLAHVLLMSDGFAFFSKTYTKAELIANCQRRGLSDMVKELRELETQDQAMHKYQRLKLHDDATAILLSF